MGHGAARPRGGSVALTEKAKEKSLKIFKL